jgi:hypothetical protein
MEFTIFTRPDVAKHLKRYVEVRLHLDKPALKDHDKVIEYKERVTQSSGIPIYVIVDPDNPEAPVDQHHGIASAEYFRQLLEKHAK